MRRFRSGSGVPQASSLAIHAVATEIAKRFADIAPDPFSCVAYETSVILTHGHQGLRHLDLADAPDWFEDSFADDLKAVVWQVLSDFQDEIVHKIGAAWPTMPTGSLAAPHCNIEDGAVVGWYGTESHVALRLDPIPVTASQ